MNATLISTDAHLLAYLGFHAPREQDLILAFAKERGVDSVRALVASALRYYHSHYHSVPPDSPLHQTIGCPDLSDGEPYDCGHHRGWLSIYPRVDGGSQCTECANAMRRADGTMIEVSP